MPLLTLARHAMATRFEIVLAGENASHLRAAGEEALDEIARLENQLSLYRGGSEISQINARAAREAVQVSPEVFALLQHAQKISAETGGAFDISIAPLVRCWGFMGANGRLPTPEEVSAAREKVGMSNVLLDAANRTIRFAREGMMLDLGAIGKGYAVERAADFLRDADVTSALIHGGTSTVCAIGVPPDAVAWRVAIDSASLPAEAQLTEPITISLRDESLSVSAASGRQFESDGKRYGHIIDPRTGQPTAAALLTVVVLPSATETDVFSTALLTLGGAGQGTLASLRPGMRTLTISDTGNGLQISRDGI